MKKIISRRYRIFISLFTLLISGVPAQASSQWPFSCESSPRDVAYSNYLLPRTAEDSRTNNIEKTSGTELHKQMGSKRNLVKDQLMSNQGSFDDHESYDYWEPYSQNMVAVY